MNIITNLLAAISPLPDGDLSDRLNYCYTTTLLIVCSAFVSGWSFVGSPIQCWFPAYYRGWWMEYALDYCYVQNTYFLAFTDAVKPDNYFDFASHIIPIPKNHTERESRQIGYYQWVPFLLAGQALMFYLPVVLWRTIASGFRVKTICETCSAKANMEAEGRGKNMDIIARFLVHDHEIIENLGGPIKRALEGRIVVFAYLFVKILYAANSLFQFLLVKWVLGADTLFWGWTVASDLAAGREWPETGNFPRVTLCDFAVRVLGNLHRHSVQCVLMINMFNEKIFVFLWFWFAFIAAFSALNCLYWLCRTLAPGSGYRLVKIYLEKIDPQAVRGMGTKNRLNDFIRCSLRADGLFLIRLIATNSGDLVTCHLISNLWRDYVTRDRVEPSTGRRAKHPPWYEPSSPGEGEELLLPFDQKKK